MKKIKKPKSKRKLLENQLDAAWAKYVKERDGVCMMCGGNGVLAAHHSFGRVHKMTRWDVDNGVALCWPCHQYRAHGDPLGYSAWFKSKFGEEKYDLLERKHNQSITYDLDCLQTMLDWFWRNKNV